MEIMNIFNEFFGLPEVNYLITTYVKDYPVANIVYEDDKYIGFVYDNGRYVVLNKTDIISVETMLKEDFIVERDDLDDIRYIL